MAELREAPKPLIDPEAPKPPINPAKLIPLYIDTRGSDIDPIIYGNLRQLAPEYGFVTGYKHGCDGCVTLSGNAISAGGAILPDECSYRFFVDRFGYYGDGFVIGGNNRPCSYEKVTREILSRVKTSVAAIKSTKKPIE